MKKSLIRQSTSNVLVSIIARIVVMLLPFVVRTVIIRTLGNLYVGVDSLFSSILNMLSLSELGFSSAVVYAMYKPVAENDEEKVRALLCFYKRVYQIVGCVILGVGLILLPNIKFFIAKGTEYPTDINIYIVYLILLINTSISYFFFAYKNSLLVATMRNDLDSLIEMCRSLVSHLLQIAILLIFRNYYLYVVILPIVTLANNIVRNVIINKKYPQYKGSKSKLSQEDKKDIMTRVGALVGHKLGGFVFTSVDSLVISAFLGLTILGQYSNYYSIFAAVYAMESTIYTAIQSTIGNILVTKSQEECYKIFKSIFIVNAAVTCFCTLCFLTLYQPFMRLWIGEGSLLGYEIPILLAAYYFVKSTRRVLFVFKEAAGMWRENLLMPYISVAVNVIFNILLVKTIGLPGVIISSIAAILLVEMPWETVVFFKKYFKAHQKAYWGKVVLVTILCVLLSGFSVALYYLVSNWISNLILQMVILLFMCLIITAIVYVPILIYSEEGKMIKPYIKSLFQKQKKSLK